MHLEEYFEIDNPKAIRLKGHRIGIETILFDYLDGLTPEEIVLRYPTLSLEEVYATVTYYHRNRVDVDRYLEEVEAEWNKAHQEQMRNPSPLVRRLYELIGARHRLSRGTTVAQQNR